MSGQGLTTAKAKRQDTHHSSGDTGLLGPRAQAIEQKEVQEGPVGLLERPGQLLEG